MPSQFKRWMPVVLLSVFGAASAAPALPAASFAEAAVRDALAPAAPVAQPRVQAPTARVAVPAPVQSARPQATRPQPTPAQVREAEISRARTQAAQQAAQAAQARARAIQAAEARIAQNTRRTGRSVIARATAYNSTPGQTDSTPFITATGTRVRSGVVALSRDLLRVFPYGSKVTVEDLSGRTGSLLRGQVFSVEDTMAARKTNSIDIWMASRSQAIRFGARQVRITAVR
ncbi:3D domain-containing protein [Deinococcus planocerae]|uniref:3D domain-containing protein n=1 Tax=Deinococcus planocerae TaxID=1737569 RepID=UPI000C7EA8F7|nr:3D domain-containing protein [Deinococcus planocerae]